MDSAIVIGGGPAGLFAASVLAVAGVETTVRPAGPAPRSRTRRVSSSPALGRAGGVAGGRRPRQRRRRFARCPRVPARRAGRRVAGGAGVSAEAVFEACRPRLMGVAYGMLGDRGEAEDSVQDAWPRFADADTDAIRNAEAFLVTITTRLAIDRLRSARARRESYVGPWLPEPLVADPAQPDPAEVVVEAERLSLALLVALERLTPVERAVLLLRDVFDLEYRRFPVSAEEEQRVVTAFFAAAATGDLEALTAVLAADAILYSDGGGVVPAARKPIYGAAKAARFILGVQRKVDFELEYAFVRVNGDPGFRFAGPEGILGVVALEVEAGHVANVRIVANP